LPFGEGEWLVYIHSVIWRFGVLVVFALPFIDIIAPLDRRGIVGIARAIAILIHYVLERFDLCEDYVAAREG
jgi:hypothetical protein